MSIMLAARASNWAVMAKDKAGERPGRGVSVKIAEYARRAGEYSIQDRQNQTCAQHNGHHSYYGEYQCLRRRVVTYTFGLHGQSPIKNGGCYDPRTLGKQRLALNADYRMRFDECHSSDWL
jgi:hypothetical protein